jgi:para-aminobenzoate synthetase component 1
MYEEIILSNFIPSYLLSIAEFFSDWEGTALLYSGGELDSAKTSFLGLFPFRSLTIKGKEAYERKKNQIFRFSIENPWEALEAHFFSSLTRSSSMAFGWFGYEMGASADLSVQIPYHVASTPDAYWQECGIVIQVDHLTQIARICISQEKEWVEIKAQPWMKVFAKKTGWEKFLQQFIFSCSVPYPTFTPMKNDEKKQDYQRYAKYFEKIARVKEYIREGEIYQANLSQEFIFKKKVDPFLIFRQMHQLNPTPFSAYISHAEVTIISCSPERFLCKKGTLLETRPIKGTISRGTTKEEDLFNQNFLLSSPKERAELLMITDLMRNDLGKVSEKGSVVTQAIWHCEAYTNVFHLLSIIQSCPHSHFSPLKIVRECFPGGSITGCPKLRAMQIIHELEKRPRGIYTGSIGYFTGEGDFDLNIAIRTLVLKEEAYSLQLGGGIVFDSIPENEYFETLVKGSSLFNLLS